MATSPNYAWAEPDNSSLVKNGASDIRTLGDAIDTSVWNVGYGQAGKNKIINGDFNINQRSFTSTTTSGTYGFDRWLFTNVGGTGTYTTQAFTLGAAPVAGYEGKNFASVQTSGQSGTSDLTIFRQYIESVRTFAGQTVAVSFWAKAASGTPKVAVELAQTFGTGGGGSADVTNYAGQVTLSTSWARYSVTVALPSIAGKTFGANPDDSLRLNLFLSAGSTLNSRTGSLGLQTNTFSFWGVQVEYGSYATPFQTATGSIQGELAACQRYYYRQPVNSAYVTLGSTWVYSATESFAVIPVPVTMRVSPSALEFSTLAHQDTGGITAITAAVFTENSSQQISVKFTTGGGLTTGRAGRVLTNNSTSGYLAFSAEL